MMDIIHVDIIHVNQTLFLLIRALSARYFMWHARKYAIRHVYQF